MQAVHQSTMTMLATMITLVMGVCVHAAEVPQEVIEKIKAVEDSLENLQVESTLQYIARGHAEGGWQEGQFSDVHGVFKGPAGGAVRITFKQMRTPRFGGPPHFSITRSEWAYNGRIGMGITTHLKEDGSPISQPEGRVFRGLPPLIEHIGLKSTAWQWTIFGLGGKPGVPYSSLLEEEVPWRSIATRNFQQYHDTLAITVTIEDRSKTWYHDPKMSYALVGFEERTKDKVDARLVINQFQEVAPGIHYPSDAVCYHYAGQSEARLIYKATKITANDPKLKDDVFTIKWPDGIRMVDEESKRAFIAGKKDTPTTQPKKGDAEKAEAEPEASR